MPAFEDTATVVALLSAYPGPLPVLRRDYLDHRWPDDDPAPVLVEYGLEPALGVHTEQYRHRAEMRHRLAEAREETVGLAAVASGSG